MAFGTITVAFGTTTVAFGTTNVGLCPEVLKTRNVIARK